MAYTGHGFWLFLAATLGLILTLPQQPRLPVLIAASLVFYCWPDPSRLLWITGTFAVAATGASGGRGAAHAANAVLLSALVLTKFAPAAGLPVPVAPPGFSFLVFTAAAYLFDVARDPARRIAVADLALHLSWFPKLLAGPIERSTSLVRQFKALALSPRLATLGFTLILSGLVKKLVIADTLVPVVDAAYAIPAYAAPIDLLIATYAFAFQIYCDFSGYSDIALGLSALVGLRLSHNFDRPYLSRSVTEFWSARWHVTLGNWFRDYVYIPMGGSRRGLPRQLTAILVVFALSGLWHAGLGYGVGWGFLVWGLLNGSLVVIERLLPAGRPRLPAPLAALLTFHLILPGWVFFRAPTISDALTILRRIMGGLTDLPTILPAYPFSTAQMLGATLITGLMVVEIAGRGRNWAEWVSNASTPVRWGVWYGALALLLLLGRWQGEGFIYARF